jgi:hypothetical protein
MGYFRFRRSIGIFPGVRWNIGKKSTSVSFGPRGLKYTIGTRGSRTTVGIPGTGISYTQVHSSKPGSTTPPPPLPPTSASMQNPAKRSRSKVFYALGFIVLALWLLGKLSEQKAPSGDVPRPTGEVYGIVGVVTADMPQAWEIAELYRAKKSVIPWGAPPGYRCVTRSRGAARAWRPNISADPKSRSST